jgi:hypothetical protein
MLPIAMLQVRPERVVMHSGRHLWNCETCGYAIETPHRIRGSIALSGLKMSPSAAMS